MIYDKLISLAYTALNTVSWHSPTLAMLNILIWTYVLPKKITVSLGRNN